MGGFTEAPPPPAAPEYPPENDFDTQAFANTFAAELKKVGSPAFDDKALSDAIAEGLMKVLAFAFKWSPVGVSMGAPLMDDPQAFYTKVCKVVAEVLVRIVTEGGKPALEILTGLTTFYTGEIVAQIAPVSRSAGSGAPSGLPAGAQALFDGVLAPLAGLTAARNPGETGAGMANSQYALGGIIGIHLHTWLINILSNLTGLGALKWINSFDEVITGSLNARALGRLALRPYLDKFIATPLTNDLNVNLPLDIGSTSQIVKRYIRGNMSADELKTALRKRGYDDSVAEDMLLDAAKLLTVSAVVYLVKIGQWSMDEAVHHLEQNGYPGELATAVFEIEWNSDAEAQYHALATDLLDLYKDHRLEHDDLVTALQGMHFTDEEVAAYVSRGAYSRETPQRLSYSQVKALYQESLVNLDYVLAWLTDERYSVEDANLLVLLEFTKKEERDQQVKLLASIRRAQLEQGLKNQAAADAARRKALSLLPA